MKRKRNLINQYDRNEIKDYINDIVRDLEGSGESMTKKICNKLIEDTMQSGGWDNISIFAIKLN